MLTEKHAKNMTDSENYVTRMKFVRHMLFTFRSYFWRLSLCILIAIGSQMVSADNSPLPFKTTTLTIGVASNFAPVFNELKRHYEAQTNTTLRPSYGATGQLYHQIRHGAPFDIFLAADTLTTQRLIKENLADPSSNTIYARGRLALWGHNVLHAIDEQTLATFSNNQRISMANPKIAPYGKAAKEVLHSLNLEHLWQNHTVLGQNITQTYQFIASKNVDFGFISLAQLRALELKHKRAQNHWLIPAHLHQPIDQSGVILSTSKHKDAAMAFLRFLKSPAAIDIMQRYGYE